MSTSARAKMISILGTVATVVADTDSLTIDFHEGNTWEEIHAALPAGFRIDWNSQRQDMGPRYVCDLVPV